MIRKKFNSASPVMALLILSVLPQSARGDGCTNIYFREGATPTIYTSVDLGTSIEFPQPYSHYLANNPEVWRVDDATTGTPDNVIIISPKVNTKAIPGGSTTTLHVFGIDAAHGLSLYRAAEGLTPDLLQDHRRCATPPSGCRADGPIECHGRSASP